MIPIESTFLTYLIESVLSKDQRREFRMQQLCIRALDLLSSLVQIVGDAMGNSGLDLLLRIAQVKDLEVCLSTQGQAVCLLLSRRGRQQRPQKFSEPCLLSLQSHVRKPCRDPRRHGSRIIVPMYHNKYCKSSPNVCFRNRKCFDCMDAGFLLFKI
jgi:hypothetical protein